jgi:peptidoglycan endopeptidase LytF
MKTGSMVRLLAGVPVVAGICLTQGCSTTSSSSSKPAELQLPVVTNVAPEVVVEVNTNVVKVESVPAVPVKEQPKEKAVLKSRPALTTPYKVKAGEGLMDIAAKYDKRWQDVMAVNPELSLKSLLRVGQTIQLPNPVDLDHPKAVQKKAKPAPVVKKPAAPVEGKTAAKPAEGKKAEAATGEGKYAVKKGDSIATIAAAHHVKRADLMKANNLTEKSVLQIGQKLAIPGKGESTAAAVAAPAETPAAPAADAAPAAVAPPADAGAVPPPPPVEATPAAGAAPAAPAAAAPAAPAAAAPAAAAETKTYTVKDGEDVYAVAIRWGVSPAELKALNNLTSADLQPGQVLKIPAVASPTP